MRQESIHLCSRVLLSPAAGQPGANRSGQSWESDSFQYILLFRFSPTRLLYDYIWEHRTASYGRRACTCARNMLIRLSISMSPVPMGMYQRLGRPVRASTALIENQRFVSLWTPTLGHVPNNAWTYREPHHRQSSFSLTGVPKAIDWAVFADWFDLSVHWRGYIPEGALEGDWWHTLAEYVVPVGNGYGVMEKVVEWRTNRILHLRRYLEAMVDVLPILSNHIPIPKMEDLTILTASHPSEVGAYHAMAKSRAQFVDLAGFFCYLREAFVEFFEDGGIDEKHFPSQLWVPWTKQRKMGYLVDFAQHWRTHNIPMWLAHNIPIHYPWSEAMADISRLARLDPEFLQAHDEDVLGAHDPLSEPAVSFHVQEEEEYNEWLQVKSHYGYNNPVQEFPNEGLHLSRIEFLFIDFEDWDTRPIDNSLEASSLSEIYFFKDRTERQSQRQYRRIYGFRPRKEDTAEHIEILLPYSTLNFPYSHRELYKFVYTTAAGTETPPNKSLLERLTLTTPKDSRAPSLGSENSDDSRSLSARSTTARRRTDKYVREQSAASRERSASPARSGHSGSSRYSRDILGQRAASPRGSDRGNRSHVVDVQMSAAPPIQSLSPEGAARLNFVLPSGNDHFPKSLDAEGRWNEVFLQQAVISFKEPNAEWRIRAWRVRNPDWPATRLLNAALSFHIPFRLEIPSSAVNMFARQKSSYSPTDLAARPFYSAGYRDFNITYDSNGAGYVQRYLASLATLLMKPNAGAFLFEGGLLSRIAREFAPPDLLNRALMGPSAAITLWNSSFRDNKRENIREFISPYEEQILIGESLITGTQTEPHSIWPAAHTFQTNPPGLWHGIWTQACEDWFQRKLGDLHANKPHAKTIGQWKAEMRQYRSRPELTTETWRQVRQDIEAADGPSWNGVALSTVMDLGVPGYQFALPYAQ